MATLTILPQGSAAYTPHAPVLIDGNAAFTPANGVTAGSGTPADPYVIEGWEINASTGNGIEIRNTDSPFVIRGVYVHSGRANFHDGIVLSQALNGRVENVTSSDNRNGLMLDSSSGAIIESNNITSNEGGIYLGSPNATVTGNIIASNRVGVHVSSVNATITANTFIDDGLFLFGLRASDYSSHTITPDNSVNGRPLLYYKDCDGLVLDGIPVGQLLVANCTNVVAANLTVTNTDVGIEMAYTQAPLIRSNNVSSNGLYGILLHNSPDSSISQNNISSNGLGLTLWGSPGAIVAQNTISENRNGLTLIASNYVIITANTFRGDGVVWGPGGPMLYDSFTITSDNSVNGRPLLYYKDCDGLVLDGISVGQLLVADCMHVVATNLTITDTDVGIQMGNVAEVLITANNLSSNNLDGVHLESSRNVTITANDASYNLQGLFVWNSSNSVIADNDASHGYHGIVLVSGTNATVTANNVTSNKGFGIDVADVPYAVVTANNVIENFQGILLHESPRATIAANNVLDNGWYGISLVLSPESSIAANNVSFSGYLGIDLRSSPGASVHHNNIINNARQASDDLENLWDDGYPSGGNYWSEYTGVDVCGGPLQNICPSPDAFGDTPRTIDADSQDRYPRMELNPDSALPRVAISTPSEGQTFASTQIPVTGTAADDGGSGLDRVEIRVDGGPWQTTSGVTAWNSSVGLAIGSNRIEARAWDRVGTPSAVDAVTVAYYPTPPYLNSCGISPSSVTLHPDETQSFALAALDQYGDPLAVVVSWNVTNGAGSINSNGVFTATTAGSGTVVANATFGSRWALCTASVTIIPGPSPTVAISSPADDQLLTSNPWEVRGTAGNATLVQVQIDAGLWNNATGNTTWYWSLDLTAYADGDHTIEARAFNGTVESPHAAVTFRLLLPPPTVTILFPAEGQTVTAGPLNITGTSAGAVSVMVRIDGGSWYPTSGPPSSWSSVWSLAGIQDQTIEAMAVNGTRRATSNVTVHAPREVPTVTITSPTTGSTLTTAKVTVSGISTHATSVKVRVDNGAWINATGDASWSLAVTDLTNGDHTFYAQAFNDSVASEIASATVKVSVPPSDSQLGILALVLLFGLILLLVLSILLILLFLWRRRRKRRGDTFAVIPEPTKAPRIPPG